MQVNLIDASGAVTTVATVDQSTNWVDQALKGSWNGIAAAQVVSNASFTLTELALQGERCFEYATVDMQQVYPVSMIRCEDRRQAMCHTNSGGRQLAFAHRTNG